MKIRSRLLLAVVASSFLFVGPAQAGRIAIDERTNPDGTTSSTSIQLSGYCDVQGQDCGDGQLLGYEVSFDGGANFFNNVIVHGNGLLTFGQAVDFETPVGSNGETLSSLIYKGANPALLDYQRTLVSAGQNNTIDDQNKDGPAFLQSATLKVVNQVIMAEWFTCMSPQSCRQYPYGLILTPTANGFQGTFSGGFDQAFVVNGEQFALGASFFIPATIMGLAAPVPEPECWVMMIAGFGLVGGALRRRPAWAKPLLG